MTPETPIFSRLLAGLIDFIIYFLFFFLLGVILGRIFGGVNEKGFMLTGIAAFLLMSLSLITYLGTATWLETKWGTSLGKMIFGLKITQADGTLLDPKKSMARNFIKPFEALCLISPAMILFSKNHQNLSNVLTNSQVVEASNKNRTFLGLTLFLILSTAMAAGSLILLSKPIFTATPIIFSDGPDGPELARAYLPGEELNAHFVLMPIQLNSNGKPDVTVTFSVKDSQGINITTPYVYNHQTNEENSAGPISLPVRFYISIPLSVAGGTYSLHYEATDKLAGATIYGQAPFSIRAPIKNNSDRLMIELLSFVSGEKDIPTDQSIFVAGQEVKAEFYATGFKLENEKPDLTLDLAVLDNNHQILLSKDAIVLFSEKMSPEDFYVPMNVTVSPPPEVEPGHYIIGLTLKDNLGQQTVKAELPFEIK